MDRPDFETWVRFSGLPMPPADQIDELRRRCAVYALKHGGDPGTTWDVALPDGGMVTIYNDWVYDHVLDAPIDARFPMSSQNRWAIQLIRMCLTRFSNDPETWIGVGMRAWLPLAMIPHEVVARCGPTSVSGEARVSTIGREMVEFELMRHQTPVKLTGKEAVCCLRDGQILLAPNPILLSSW